VHETSVHGQENKEHEMPRFSFGPDFAQTLHKGHMVVFRFYGHALLNTANGQRGDHTRYRADDRDHRQQTL